MTPSDAPATTLGSRVAAAFASLILSLPVLGLLWFLSNVQLGLFTDGSLSPAYLVYAILGFAACGFIFPRFTDALIGGLYGLLRWIARLW